jgi:hypothetical protein
MIAQPMFAGQMLRGKHVPAWQTSLFAQPLRQTPQWASSLWVLAQVPLQQVSAPGQAVPHPPQCASSVWISRQTSPQSVNPPGQTHWPLWQIRPPLHAPHEPPQPLSPQVFPPHCGTQDGGGGVTNGGGVVTFFLFLFLFLRFFLVSASVRTSTNGSEATSGLVRLATTARREGCMVSARTAASKRWASKGRTFLGNRWAPWT